MKLQNASHQHQQQEIIVAFVCMVLGVLGILLFIQERLIYYLIGFLSFAAIAWCQFQPRRWVYLAFISMPLSPSVPLYRIKYMVTAELSDFVAMAAIMVFFLNFVLGNVKRRGWDSYVMIPLFLFFLSELVSSFTAFYVHYDKFLVANALGHLVKWSLYVMLYVTIYKTFNEKSELVNLIRVIGFAFLAGGAVVVYNYATHQHFVGPSQALYRAAGWFEGVNSFGVVLSLIIIFLYNLYLSGQYAAVLPRYLFLGLWVGILLAVIATLSRTAWAALGGTLVILSFIRGRRYMAVLFIMGSLIVFLLFGKPVEKRVESTFEDQSWSTLPVDIGGRERIWRTSMQHIAEYPLTGVGYSNFGQYVLGTTPHNQYIAILGESGMLGILAFAFFIYRFSRANLYLYRRQKDPFFKACASGSMNVWIVMLFVSGTGEYFIVGVFVALMMAFYACPRVAYQMEMEKNQREMDAKFKAPLSYKLMPR